MQNVVSYELCSASGRFLAVAENLPTLSFDDVVLKSGSWKRVTLAVSWLNPLENERFLDGGTGHAR